MKYIVYVLLVLSLSGCISSSQSPQTIKEKDITTIVHDEGQKTAYLKEHGTQLRLCAARESDSVKENANAFSLGFSTLGKGENAGDSSSAGAVSLGGRDPIVLMTREVLFRACEMSMNLNLDKQETMDTYKMFLDFVLKVSKNDKNEGVASISSSVSANSNSSINDTKENEEDEDNDEGDEL